MATISGTSGNDDLQGTNAADILRGLAGNDSLIGRDGNDTLYGDAGNDGLYGGTGNDRMWGGTGIDALFGQDGDDQLYGEAGDDYMLGGKGNDYLHGGFNNDRLRGEDGNDTLNGANGTDNLQGGAGNDTVHGGEGNDNLYGDAGTDMVSGDAGKDVVKGGTGISYLYGGSGDDQLYYNPTKSDILTVGNYLETTILDGEVGNDVLNIFNEATYKDASGEPQKAFTTIGFDDYKGYISFTPQPEDAAVSAGIPTGSLFNVEEIKVTGDGLYFNGDLWGYVNTKITGTTSDDEFHSYYAHDTMIGGGGDDVFYFGGLDKVISSNIDADEFHFQAWESGGTAKLTGFNGEGQVGGDVLYIDSADLSDPETQVVESGGKTTFTLNGGSDAVEIDSVGLVQGQDWFLV